MISLAELQRRIDSGDLSADAAIAQSLEAIGAHEKTIGAFVCHDRKRPRAQAPGRCAASRSASRTSWIPRIFRPRWARRSTGDFGRAAMRRSCMMLKQAGATIIGKTTTTAFASIDPTATLNPHNHGHTPGGSSSGSAAAVGGRHDSAGAGDADRRLGDPAGLVLRRRRDQAVLPLAADGRREMLFVDAGYRRAVRGRRATTSRTGCRR